MARQPASSGVISFTVDPDGMNQNPLTGPLQEGDEIDTGTPGGVAEYTGKYLGTWPGQTKPFGYEPGPYADEKPILTITSQNAAQHAAKLTAGNRIANPVTSP